MFKTLRSRKILVTALSVLFVILNEGLELGISANAYWGIASIVFANLFGVEGVKAGSKLVRRK